jgi:thioredoxin 1
MAGQMKRTLLNIRNPGNLHSHIALILLALMSIYLCSCQKKNEDAASSDVTAKEISEGAPNSEAEIPRLVELGSVMCIPCKMMAPILEELKKEYTGKLQVDFIDVKKDPEVGRKHGVRIIPTQIFYDANGKELYRHQGFIDKGDILAAFRKNGIDFDAM